jgi:hypothetical protein
VCREFKAPPGLLESLASKAFKETKVPLAFREFRVRRDYRAFKGYKVSRESKVSLG